MEKLEHLRLPNEKWVFIEGTGDKYAISDLGRVASFWKRDPFIMRTPPATNGYFKTMLTVGGKAMFAMPHRLVAIHFIPNPEGKKEVNHKNGDKTDNRAVNLEWNTRTENVRHSVALGLHRGFEKGKVEVIRKKGAEVHTAKLTEDQVRAIRADKASGLKYREIAAKHNISMSLVTTALTCWKHIK